MQTILSSIDLFGLPIVITLFGREKAKTRFGGLFSLLFFGFVVWAIYNGAQDLFSTLKPKVITYDSYSGDPRALTISRENFPIAVGIQAPLALGYKGFRDESIYTVEMIHAIQRKIYKPDGTYTTNLTTHKLNVGKCRSDHFSMQESSLSLLNLQNFYCIDDNQPEVPELQIQGVTTSDIYQYVHVRIYQCDNKTSPIPCAPQNKIDAYLSGGYFNAFYVNMNINPQNYSHPNATYKDVYYTMISTGGYKEGDVKLGYVEIATDNGLLTESTQTKSYIKVNQVLEFQDPTPKANRMIMLCKFRVSQIETYSSRSYKKLQDVIAGVGGMVNAMLIGLLILITPFVRLKFRETLINEWFDIKVSSKGTGKKKRGSYTKLSKMASDISKQSNPGITSGPVGGQEKNALGLIKERLKLRVNTYQESKTMETGVGLKSPGEKTDTTPLGALDSARSPITLPSTTRGRENEGLMEQGLPKKEKSISPENHPQKKKTKSIGFINLKTKSKHGSKDEKVLKPVRKSLKEDNSLHLSFSSEDSSVENQPEIEAKGVDRPKEEVSQSQQEEAVSSLPEPSLQSDFSKAKKNLGNVRHTPIHFSVWEFLMSKLYQPKKMKQKIRMFQEGGKHVDERLDLFNIIKKLREIDKLRVLLLDADQLALFNHLPKPEIKDNKDAYERKDTLTTLNTLNSPKFVEDINLSEAELSALLNRLKCKPIKNEIDMKLLRIFEDQE